MTQRVLSWSRSNTLAVSIAAGRLLELGVVLTEADVDSISARAYVDDASTTLTPITGASAVDVAWDAARQKWVGLLPYVAAFDALDTVRVVVTAVVGGSSERLLDASAPFTTADGR